MKVKFKKLNSSALEPTQANPGDAGYDLTASAVTYPSISEGIYIEVCTGLSFEIPKGYVGLLFPRSSISKTKHFLRNSVGVIDSGYRGEVKLRFSTDDTNTSYKVGDRIGQIVFVRLPKIELIESIDLSASQRNTGGFGSSGY
jgi:dUTP pyrophosphatase